MQQDEDYFSPQLRQQQQHASTLVVVSAQQFWRELMACAYIGSFEQVGKKE